MIYGRTTTLFGIIIKLNSDDDIYTSIANFTSFSMIMAARKKVLSAKKNNLFVGSTEDTYSDTVDKRVTIPPKAIFLDLLLYLLNYYSSY